MEGVQNYIMRKNISLAISITLALILSGCGAATQVSEEIIDSARPEVTDVFTRLNDEGSYEWGEDRFNSITETSVMNIYFGGGCAVWVFPTYAEAKNENDDGGFDFYKGEVWYGEDSVSGRGIVLLTEDQSSRCSQVVFDVFDWTIEEGEEEDSAAADVSSSSMAGKWGSYSWMDDSVGAFLIVKSLGGSDYSGIFYTQGQSGGVYKDSEIFLTDIGDGLAEVQWPSGNVTTATWGKPDTNTSSDMSDSWNGDIWFDCIGELGFAESRADCNFYFSN